MVVETKLSLAELRHLFVAPAAEPFARRATEVLGESGLELLLRQQPVGREFALCLTLPREQLRGIEVADVRAALRRWCDLHCERLDLEIAALRSRTRHMLLLALAFLVVATALSQVLGGALFDFLPTVLRTSLREGLLVLGWVVLWRPAETFLLDPLALRQRRNLLQRLGLAQIRIDPE